MKKKCKNFANLKTHTIFVSTNKQTNTLMFNLSEVQIAAIEKALFSNHPTTLWNGKRIYVKGMGWNTKKVKQTIYLDLYNLEFKAKTEGVNTDVSWDISQSELLEERANETFFNNDRIGTLKNILGEDFIDAALQARQEVLAEEIQGWYIKWERAVINSYGKLSSENKPHIGVYKGPKGDAPGKITPLNDEQFARATKRKGERIEAYKTPNFDVDGYEYI